MTFCALPACVDFPGPTPQTPYSDAAPNAPRTSPRHFDINRFIAAWIVGPPHSFLHSAWEVTLPFRLCCLY